jgi:hypothetical protein
VSVLDDLQGIEERVAARLKELRPLVDEYAELQRVAERLGVEVPTEPAERPRRRRRATTRTSRKAPAATPRKRSTRSRPGGTQATGAQRRARTLELIEQRPGITVPEISADIGVSPPPMYRVIRKLQADGLVKKEGKGLKLA